MARAASSLDGSLPHPRTELIGREAERRHAAALLLDDVVPLLTLTGPGGSGKTRLALAIARDVEAQFADGAIWVDLAPLTDPWLLPDTLARALGIVPVAGLPVAEQVVRALGPRQTLVLLDNCEHLLHAVSDSVATVLAACPAVQVLATSRAPLHHRGERELPVEPFPLPSPDAQPDALSGNDAVRLFVERAHAVDPGFALTHANAPTVAEVCRRLDGLPLAIELAAARSKVLSPEALLALMSDRMRLLSGGPWDLPARQQTIRDTIAWSYAILSPNQQDLFRRLSVFAGGWRLDATAAVVGGRAATAGDVLDDLGALLDHSLVRRTGIGGDVRFSMLETIREFGLAELGRAGDDDDARGRHAAWCRALVEALDLHHTMQRDSARMARLLPEQDNLRLALGWFARQGDSLSLSIMSAAMSIFWPSFGQFAEARKWLREAIAHGAGVPPELLARVWHEAGWLAMCQGELGVARPLLDEGLKLARLAGDPYLLAEAILASGIQAFWEGDLEQAAALMEEGKRSFQRLGPGFTAAPAKAGAAVNFLGNIALVAGDVPLAIRRGDEAVGIARALGATADLGYALCGLAYAKLLDGEAPAATACILEAAAVTWTTGDDAFLARLLWAMAAVAAADAKPAIAARLIGAADAVDARTGGAMWPADRVVAGLCVERLDNALDPAAMSALRREGASLSAAQSVAAVRLVAATILGVEPADAIWAATNAPDPGSVGEDLLRMPPIGRVGDGIGTNRHSLTRREREVFELMRDRLTDREIGDRLFISPRTVEVHVANVVAKLGVANRRDAAAVAARLEFGIEHSAASIPGRHGGVEIGELTVRERDVLRHLVDGLTDREIAEHLRISRRTVSKHVEGILAKLGVRSRGAAVAEATRRGWTPAPTVIRREG